MAPVEKCVEWRDTSKLAKQRVDILDFHHTPALESAYSQTRAMVPLAGAHTPQGNPPQQIVSQRVPSVLLEKPRMPSPRPAKIIGEQWKVSEEVRPATKKWQDAELLPSAKSVNSATEIDRCGRPIPKLWYYPKPQVGSIDWLESWTLGGAIQPERTSTPTSKQGGEGPV